MNTVKEGVNFNLVEICDNTKIANWLKRTFNAWEPFTFESFRQAANPNKIAIDVGSWIGLTGIWLCKNFKHVLCVEADKLSVKALEANLKASDCQNYSIIPYALYNSKTKLYFGPNSFIENPTLNDSMSQLKTTTDKSDDYAIDTIIFSDIIKDIPVDDIGLLKVDIEGGEENIIEELMLFSTEHKIPILLSFHISWWKNKNVDRFVHLFETCTIKTDSNDTVTNLSEFLTAHPFCTFFCTYV